jgi:hypothetical protein
MNSRVSLSLLLSWLQLSYLWCWLLNCCRERSSMTKRFMKSIDEIIKNNQNFRIINYAFSVATCVPYSSCWFHFPGMLKPFRSGWSLIVNSTRLLISSSVCKVFFNAITLIIWYYKPSFWLKIPKAWCSFAESQPFLTNHHFRCMVISYRDDWKILQEFLKIVKKILC